MLCYTKEYQIHKYHINKENINTISLQVAVVDI